MNRETIAIVGLLAAGAFGAAGAQVARESGRGIQFSLGVGGAMAQVATGEDYSYARGGNYQPLVGTVMLGTGIGEHVVVGVDVFRSWITPGARNLSTNADNTIGSVALLAKLYPARHGLFVELGAGLATADVDLASAGLYSMGRWTARGGALRYGIGYDVVFASGWALTPYLSGMFMPKPAQHAYACDCSGGIVLNGGPDPGLPVAGSFPPKFDAPAVNVVHIGVAFTYTRHSGVSGR